MKIMYLMAAVILLLCGCGAEQIFETVADEMVLNASAQPHVIQITLPEKTLLPAMETDWGTLYLCDGYDVAVQTFQSGDLDGTFRQISGFGSDELTLMQTRTGALSCYEFVWTAATELGQQVGRAMVLADENYHYALSAIAPAERAQEYQEIWNGIFDSFAVT